MQPCPARQAYSTCFSPPNFPAIDAIAELRVPLAQAIKGLDPVYERNAQAQAQQPPGSKRSDKRTLTEKVNDNLEKYLFCRTEDPSDPKRDYYAGFDITPIRAARALVLMTPGVLDLSALEARVAAMNSITLETKEEGIRTRAVKPSEHAIVVIADSTQRADNLEAAVGPWLAQFFRRNATTEK